MVLTLKLKGRRMEAPLSGLQRLHNHFERWYPKYTLHSCYDRLKNQIILYLTPK